MWDRAYLFAVEVNEQLTREFLIDLAALGLTFLVILAALCLVSI